MTIQKEIVVVQAGPKAIGPYSLGVKAGGLMFTAGQTGVDPATRQLADGVAAQARQAITNMRTILEAAGLSLAHVVKTTVFLQDIRDFAVFNEVYASFFAGDYPARSTVQVAALPGGAAIEIESIAVLP
jgi:2-iminobutanoate/2-iminopropanoate deaminase